jgi:general secretion pathway protein G
MGESHARLLARGALLGILACLCGAWAAACADPFAGPPRQGAEEALRSNLKTLRKAIDLYKADRGHYPESLEALVDEKYLRAIPYDPITKRADTWIPIYEEVDHTLVLSGTELTHTGSQGIIDIRSGAKGRSLDGRLYAEL